MAPIARNTARHMLRGLMATIEHEALVDLFRRDPALIARLLSELLAAPLPRHATAAVVDASLGQLVPTEFRADLMVVLRDDAGVPVLAIVIEVQRRRDAAKRLSWPVYLAAARARFGCAACVVVIAPRASVARWAAEPIDMGLDRAIVRPVVLGPDEVPRVDEAKAATHLELALLSVIVHGSEDSALETAQGAIVALAAVDAPMRADYLYVILRSLRRSLREPPRMDHGQGRNEGAVHREVPALAR